MKIRASHILVSDLDRAKELHKQIIEGADFANIAQQYSACPSRQAGGDLGPFGRGQMVQPFEHAAYTTEIGAVSKPVQTQFGWHIIKRTG